MCEGVWLVTKVMMIKGVLFWEESVLVLVGFFIGIWWRESTCILVFFKLLCRPSIGLKHRP